MQQQQRHTMFKIRGRCMKATAQGLVAVVQGINAIVTGMCHKAWHVSTDHNSRVPKRQKEE
jgi:hypothetical protein